MRAEVSSLPKGLSPLVPNQSASNFEERFGHLFVFPPIFLIEESCLNSSFMNEAVGTISIMLKIFGF
jgi:hypothetical protein